MKRSWSLSRRTFLHGSAASIALPLLDAMASPGRAAAASTPPTRMAFIYVPNGVNILKWLPKDDGHDYGLSPALTTLSDLKNDFTLLSQLSHPKAKGGHSGGDSWLTGADLFGTPGFDYKNSISVDQVAAEKIGIETRFPSLELSALGGTGQPGHSTTLAFSRQGIPLPAEKYPRMVFERLFAPDSGNSRAEKKYRIAENKSILDTVLSEAMSLNNKLGRHDQDKLDEYLTSVREIETRVSRSEQWLDIPKAKVDSRGLPLDAEPGDSAGSHVYYQLMFDLMFLAFQTDTTRIATFQLSREAHGGWLRTLGLKGSHHELSHHGGDADMLDSLHKIDKFYLQQLAHFMNKLKSHNEGGSSLLDRTMIVYGSGMNSGEGGGHSAKNLPLIFAGGRELGFQLGQHLAFKDGVPLSNVYTLMLDKMGVRQKFNDSTGPLEGLAS